MHDSARRLTRQPEPLRGPFTPLPGTDAPRRGLFVDRWGTLLALPERGFCRTFAEAEFTGGAVDALFRAHNQGFSIYLLGNETAVARGRQSERSWRTFEAELLEHLAAHGVPVRRSYACLEDPEHGGGPQRDSVFRLPNTGAMYHAMQHDGIELGHSWVVGDSSLEIAAGWRSGCHVAGVRTGEAVSDAGLEVEPELVCDDLAAAVLAILERLPHTVR